MKNENTTVNNATVEEGVKAGELLEGLTPTMATPMDAIIEDEEQAIGSGISFPLISEPYRMNGNTFYSYYVPFVVLDEEMKCELRPAAISKSDNDRNAYILLTKIFNMIEKETGKREFVLHCQKKARKDDFGRRTASMVYEVIFKDPKSGAVLTVGMKPYGDSNRRLLESQYAAAAKF